MESLHYSHHDNNTVSSLVSATKSSLVSATITHNTKGNTITSTRPANMSSSYKDYAQTSMNNTSSSSSSTNNKDNNHMRSSGEEMTALAVKNWSRRLKYNDGIITFPQKLFLMLSNPDLEDIITWLPHGRAWKILKPKIFEQIVLPKYFKGPKYTSFVRQVNGWGFRRITYHTYYHEMFLRGMPQLVVEMRRLTQKDMKFRKEEGNKAQTNFHKYCNENPLPPLRLASTRATTRTTTTAISTTPRCDMDPTTRLQHHSQQQQAKKKKNNNNKQQQVEVINRSRSPISVTAGASSPSSLSPPPVLVPELHSSSYASTTQLEQSVVNTTRIQNFDLESIMRRYGITPTPSSSSTTTTTNKNSSSNVASDDLGITTSTGSTNNNTLSKREKIIQEREMRLETIKRNREEAINRNMMPMMSSSMSATPTSLSSSSSSSMALLSAQQQIANIHKLLKLN